MIRKFYLVSFLLMFPIFLSATSAGHVGDKIELILQPALSYRDLSVLCSTTAQPQTLYFSAEISGNVIRQAHFRTEESALPTQAMTLTAQEAGSIEWQAMASGQRWIKHINLKERTLKWLLANAGTTRPQSCVPSLPIARVQPEEVVFEFDLEGAFATPASAPSSLANLSGKLTNEEGFQAEVYFIQKQK